MTRRGLAWVGSHKIATAVIVVVLALIGSLGGSPRDQTAANPTPSAPAAARATADVPTGAPTVEPTLTPTPTAEPGFVSREMFGDDWPLTVESGTVHCDLHAVTINVPGHGVYALNGLALSSFPDLPKIEEIWAPNPEIPGLKISIGPLIQLGLKLCEG